MVKRCFGGTDFTPSTPAVFFPWLSCVTRRTESLRAALAAHQQFLEFVDCSLIATLFGFEDALLYALDMLLKRVPGQRVPTFTLRIRCLPFPGCLRVCHTTRSSSFPITVPTSAYPTAFLLAFAS